MGKGQGRAFVKSLRLPSSPNCEDEEQQAIQLWAPLEERK
jgi:hypothetical protein